MNKPHLPGRRAMLTYLAGAVAVTTMPLHAQTFPSRPITIIVPTEAGAGPDVLARLVATPMAALLGQPVVIENRAGAAGNIGAAMAARAAPDGHTLLLMATVHTISASATQRPGYSPVDSFTPIGLVSASPLVLVAAPSTGFKKVKDLANHARARPGSLNYASPGNASIQHLATEMLARKIGVQLTHVPYKSGAAAAVSVAAGETQIGFLSIPAALPLVASGRLVVLGISGAQSDAVPGATALSVQLGADFQVENWFALVAPAGTPAPVVQRLHGALNDVLKTSAVKTQFEKAGAPVRTSTTLELGQLIARETAGWKKVITDANLKFND